MCTLVILRRPGAEIPLLVAANRDELRHRPWRPPARHWPDRPLVIGGQDLLAGGSWLTLGDQGLIAAVLNRRGSLGPAPGMRSRGELVLLAQDHDRARDAAMALGRLPAGRWRPFNLVLADAREAFWLRHDGSGAIERRALPVGLSMLAAGELDDPGQARIHHHLPLFRAAPPPAPERGDWHHWEALLASRVAVSGDPRDAMAIQGAGGYGTVAASLVALGREPGRAWLRFACGRPGEAAFRDLGTVAPPG